MRWNFGWGQACAGWAITEWTNTRSQKWSMGESAKSTNFGSTKQQAMWMANIGNVEVDVYTAWIYDGFCSSLFRCGDMGIVLMLTEKWSMVDKMHLDIYTQSHYLKPNHTARNIIEQTNYWWHLGVFQFQICCTRQMRRRWHPKTPPISVRLWTTISLAVLGMVRQ